MQEGTEALNNQRIHTQEYYSSLFSSVTTNLSLVFFPSIPGLANHKDELGAPLCPCRHYEDKAAEVNLAYWNCPCVPMRERKECHCMLFLTKDNPFVGDKQQIQDEVSFVLSLAWHFSA